MTFHILQDQLDLLTSATASRESPDEAAALVGGSPSVSKGGSEHKRSLSSCTGGNVVELWSVLGLLYNKELRSERNSMNERDINSSSPPLLTS